MKRIFTLAAILFSVTSFAAEHPRPNGNLSIKSNSDQFLQVVIDGRAYDVHCNAFVMDNIRPGRHCVEVYRVDNYGMFRRRPQMIYSTSMMLRPWDMLDININRFERVWVTSHPVQGEGYGQNDRDYRGDRDGDYDHDRGYSEGPAHGNRDGSWYRH